MKKTANVRIVILMAIVAITFQKNSDAQFTLSGEIRPRTEISHGYKSLASPDQDPSTVTTQRSRLYFDYTNEQVKTKLVLQDVRVYGSQPQLVGNEDFATSIHEAWAEIKFAPGLSLKIGRQEVVYDDHRIFGSVGWAQQARSHDMAIFKLDGDLKLHLGIAHHENGGLTSNYYSGPDLYKDLQFLWANTKISDLTISFLALNKGNTKYPNDTTGTKETVYTQTLGPRLSYNTGGIGFAGYFYYQTGESLSAYDLGIEASYKISDGLKAVAGYELLSGNDFTTTDQEAFTPFFGTNHKFNGFMDYFYVGNHVGSIGLSDVYVKGIYKAGKFTAQAHAHIFGAAEAPATFDGTSLGTEIDLVFTYKISDVSAIACGYSQMFGTDNMVLLKGGDKSAMSNWAWLMITIKPTFFSTKQAE